MGESTSSYWHKACEFYDSLCVDVFCLLTIKKVKVGENPYFLPISTGRKPKSKFCLLLESCAWKMPVMYKLVNLHPPTESLWLESGCVNR